MTGFGGPVTIFGALGMLGRVVAEQAEARGGVVVRRDLAETDITDPAACAVALAEDRPALVINAAAYTDVDGAEADEAAAHRLNGDAPGHLAEACAAHGAVLVHYSTDYVFDGRGAGPPIPATASAPGAPRGR